VVYQAEQTSTGRAAALKVFSLGTVRDMTARERLTGRWMCCRDWDGGRGSTRGGTPGSSATFVATELVEGTTVDVVLAQASPARVAGGVPGSLFRPWPDSRGGSGSWTFEAGQRCGACGWVGGSAGLWHEGGRGGQGVVSFLPGRSWGRRATWRRRQSKGTSARRGRIFTLWVCFCSRC